MAALCSMMTVICVGWLGVGLSSQFRVNLGECSSSKKASWRTFQCGSTSHRWAFVLDPCTAVNEIAVDALGARMGLRGQQRRARENPDSLGPRSILCETIGSKYPDK